MNRVYEVEELAHEFRNASTDEHVLVDIGGRDPIAVKCQASRSNRPRALVVLFHGAISRSKGTPVPSFLNFRRSLSEHAHQISIADPGVEETNDVGIGWFAGSQHNFAQELLPAFFMQLEKDLGVDHTIYVGSSAGGFGALFYSWHHPGSTVCASVPQTSAWAYHESARKYYLRDCWPEGIENYEKPPILDLRELYSRNVPNRVVYVQSALDDLHLKKHMIPFLASLPEGGIENVALKVSYWGRPGHSGAVPPGELDGWIKAVISASERSASAIISAYQQSGVETTPMSEVLMKEAGAAKDSSKLEASPLRKQQREYQDITWTKMIAEVQLREEL